MDKLIPLYDSRPLAHVSEVRSQDFERAALAFIAAKNSIHTRKAYLADFERWLRFCYASGILPEAPTLEATTAFRDALRAEVSAISTRRVLSAMSSIYRALLKARVVRGNPFHPEALAWPASEPIGKTPVVPEHVAEAMLENAENDPDTLRGRRDAAILRILYDSGLRRASVACITRVGIEPDRLQTIVKGGSTGYVGITANMRRAIDRWLAVAPESPHLFPGKCGEHIHVETLNKIINARANAIGAEGVHPHCFRAAYITTAYNAGIPEREIQASTHHKDVNTTRGYDRDARGLQTAANVAEFRAKRKL